jgi:flagellar hook-basal body complex protein FliE
MTGPVLDTAAQFRELPGAKSIPSAAELEGLQKADSLQPAAPADASAGFEGVLKDFVGQVNAKQAAAGQAVSELLSGQQLPLHQAVIAMEEASVSFQLMVEVRNKLLESYQELMRMQV